MSDLESDAKKYESDLEIIRNQLSELDKNRADLIRIGTRIEGALAYIKLKLSVEDPEKAKEAKDLKTTDII